MFDIDGELISGRPLLVAVEALQPYPCALAWCNNTQLSGRDEAGHCLCDDCNREKWYPVTCEADFVAHQEHFRDMTVEQYRSFVAQHGGICREGTDDEMNTRIVQREFNLLIGLG